MRRTIEKLWLGQVYTMSVIRTLRNRRNNKYKKKMGIFFRQIIMQHSIGNVHTLRCMVKWHFLSYDLFLRLWDSASKINISYKKPAKKKKLVSNNVTSRPDAKNCSRFSKPYKNWLALWLGFARREKIEIAYKNVQSFFSASI